jgi:hypothetical protein
LGNNPLAAKRQGLLANAKEGQQRPHLGRTSTRSKNVCNGSMIDTTTASGRLMFEIFAALAEFERELIVERTRAGVAAAQATHTEWIRPKDHQDSSFANNGLAAPGHFMRPESFLALFKEALPYP